MTKTSSTRLTSTSGTSSANWNNAPSSLSILVIVPMAKPRGNPPTNPEVTTRSPARAFDSNGIYFILASPIVVPSTIPSSRVRWTKPAIALFGSVTSSTTDVAAVVLTMRPTTPSDVITPMSG